MLSNPPLTGRPGRPRSDHCKRGHRRLPGETSCAACRRLCRQWQYAGDAEFREKEKARTWKWHQEFREKNGFWASQRS